MRNPHGMAGQVHGTAACHADALAPGHDALSLRWRCNKQGEAWSVLPQAGDAAAAAAAGEQGGDGNGHGLAAAAPSGTAVAPLAHPPGFIARRLFVFSGLVLG